MEQVAGGCKKSPGFGDDINLFSRLTCLPLPFLVNGNSRSFKYLLEPNCQIYRTVNLLYGALEWFRLVRPLCSFYSVITIVGSKHNFTLVNATYVVDGDEGDTLPAQSTLV